MTTAGTDAWSRFWASRPHIRVGDPCFHCGTPMTPASRPFWTARPAGHRIHGSHGLCRLCYTRLRAGRLEGLDLDSLTSQTSKDS